MSLKGCITTEIGRTTNMMKIKARGLIVLVLFITLVFVGCTTKSPTLDEMEEKDGNITQEEGNSIFPREIIDGFGNKVTIDKKPERIITAVPSHTEILFALGLEDNIVAVSEYCDYPAGALDKENIGGYKTLNTERIIELQPDILFVYGDGDDDAIEQVDSAGITIVRYEPESIEEVLETIISIGQVVGEEEKAEEIRNQLIEKKEEVLDKIKNQQQKRVFYEIWDEPLMAAGPGSFMDELIVLAKGKNIASDAEGGYPVFSIEALVERDPEVYLIPANHVQNFDKMTDKEKNQRITEIKNRPGYEDITAIKNDRIELLEPNIVSRPGIRIIEALEIIAKAIHPDIF